MKQILNLQLSIYNSNQQKCYYDNYYQFIIMSTLADRKNKQIQSRKNVRLNLSLIIPYDIFEFLRKVQKDWIFEITIFFLLNNNQNDNILQEKQALLIVQ
ncbi:unnamed protein product [Paramecium octaurelia]|uniref:Uncharacterized protein n=1 Tax=Paramecium octaurelia TaxID=43137 RepID=A0A8S1TUF0_PAROT|nr:unnamed protein product [Paramecium octaurelia]